MHIQDVGRPGVYQIARYIYQRGGRILTRDVEAVRVVDGLYKCAGLLKTQLRVHVGVHRYLGG